MVHDKNKKGHHDFNNPVAPNKIDLESSNS